jgi:hypothetical protein
MTALQTNFRCGGFTLEGKQDRVAIPRKLRCALEKALSSDLSSVRLWTHPGLEDLGALACMQGEDVCLSPSAPALDTPAGVAVLGHELGHVLQQRAGRVCVAAANAVVEDEALEREADLVGLHCAARIFPALLSDPGLPSAARSRGGLVRGSGPAPIQFLITSRESYEDFVAAAYDYLTAPLVNQLSASVVLSTFYRYVASYNPHHAPAKNPLGGQALYQSMAGYILATRPHPVVMQGDDDWPDITADVRDFANYYTAKGNGNVVPLNPEAEEATGTYLHVYPIQPAPANWRIGLNVLPADMAVAMANLTALLNNNDSIDHMKFLSPGNASKADSVIVYCNHDGDDYDQLEQAVLNAAANLNFQQRVAAMWEEIEPGIGLASEPPMGGVSFSEYRCMIVYLAYRQYRRGVQQRGEEQTFDDFMDYLDGAMWIFGVDSHRPHEQGPLQRQFQYFNQWWNALEALRVRWRTGR